MNSSSARNARLKWGLMISVLAGALAASAPLRSRSSVVSASGAEATSQEVKAQKPAERFDMLVRDDFFAGMAGDTARLDRGMKFCEEVLAKNPKHAEALVWHGGGLLTRATNAYTKGESELGDRLWNRGLQEMNDATLFEPENMGVKIGRSATLIGIAQSGWDPSDQQGKALLESALVDYEKVYGMQKPVFNTLPVHGRGELLFGLASGWSILGKHEKARDYLLLVVKECKDSAYEREAEAQLKIKPPSVIEHNCIGCHVSR